MLVCPSDSTIYGQGLRHCWGQAKSLHRENGSQEQAIRQGGREIVGREGMKERKGGEKIVRLGIKKITK